MKRGVLVLALFVSLFLTSFVSAEFFDNYYGGYGGSFSLGDFFNSLDPSTVVYGLLFFIFFTIIFLILTKINLFKHKRSYYGFEETNTTAAGIVAFAISALIIYYMYRQDYNLESFFYELGFSGDMLSFLLIIVIILAIFVILRWFVKNKQRPTTY